MLALASATLARPAAFFGFTKGQVSPVAGALSDRRRPCARYSHPLNQSRGRTAAGRGLNPILVRES